MCDEIFTADFIADFIAAALLHIPPKGQQTVRYYGLYSNKTRGQTSLIPERIIRPRHALQRFKTTRPKTQDQNPRLLGGKFFFPLNR